MSAPIWSTHMTTAPCGHTEPQERKTKDGVVIDHVWRPDFIWAASKCGKVISTWWMRDESRWCFFANGEQPLAWRPFIDGEFPKVGAGKDATWPNGKTPAYPAELVGVAA